MRWLDAKIDTIRTIQLDEIRLICAEALRGLPSTRELVTVSQKS